MSESDPAFDYIVAGAGSAGCVIAARLSESGKYSVLLLEAGPSDDSFWIPMPLAVERLFKDPKHNWMYQTEPVPGLGDRSLYEPRGKVLGGSSSINGMVYVRGNARDYDLWRQTGCTGWGYDDVLPFFRKAEDQERGADHFHGVGGPLAVSDAPERSELMTAIIAAAGQIGIPYTPDFNGAQQEGAGYYQSTIRRGRRCSTARGYLRPARRRANLRIVTGARATRILFENGRAAGIEYRTPAGIARASARREVIVSGGAFGSPQLLMLSGIGPAEHLRAFGIDVHRDAPAVGANLGDHVGIMLQFRCLRPATLNIFANSRLRQVAAGVQYLLFGTGPCTQGIPGAVFTRSDPRLERPDIQIQLFPWSFAADDPRRTITHRFHAFALHGQYLHPRSAGSVRLKSVDPLAAPSIRPDFLSDPADMTMMVRIFRLLRELVAQPALASYAGEELAPSAELRSDTEIADHIRMTAGSTAHAVGTCRMGPNDDDVLDPRLRVRGVAGLRVADASIMPSVPFANINAPTIMIGEKASAMILADAAVT